MPHVSEILETGPDVPWFEVLADNWMAPGGLNPALLEEICERYPVVLHSVGLSLGASDPLDMKYLERIRHLQQITGAQWYSEHCSFSVHQGQYFPDLLPLPFTEEAVAHVSQRIRQVQDFLGERMLLENVSSYLQSPDNQMSEAEFIGAIAESADCLLLLDINNCFVSEYNNGESAQDFLRSVPLQRVRQVHLAGHENKDNYLLDAHNQPVAAPVWDLFAEFLELYAPVPTLIEWDHDIPALEVLLQERQQAQTLLDQAIDSKRHAVCH